MSLRLATSILVGGLIRKAEADGGFAAVLAKGDATAGSVIVVLKERGGSPSVFERILQTDGHYGWQENRDETFETEGLSRFVVRRRRFDPDLWVLELDVPSAERFAAEMTVED